MRQLHGADPGIFPQGDHGFIRIESEADPGGFLAGIRFYKNITESLKLEIDFVFISSPDGSGELCSS